MNSEKKLKELIILGIDPGLADTGYGVIKKDGQKLEAVAYGSIKTKRGLPLAERLLQIEDNVSKLIKKYKPNRVVIEELFFCKNARTALVVGQARGVVILSAAKNGIPILEFTPLQVKQAATGYGQADKRQVQEMVKVILNLKNIPQPDDAADALAIAICGSNNYYHDNLL
ncbi:MAG: crossover junction endodeoxyribonuclease RuvC [Patescibacteria group bacterium]